MISSSNQVGGALPGLSLKAWAHVASNGTLIRGFNVASSAKGGTGIYTVTFSAAMTANTFIARVTIDPLSGGGAAGSVANRTTFVTGSIGLTIYSYLAAAQDTTFFIEVYE